jgi:ribokinase
MASRPRLAVIGSIVIDILVATPHLPGSGENLHVPRIQVTPGGKALNAAVAFTRLGGQAYLLGNMGDDFFADYAAAALQREGVDIGGVGRDPTAETGAGVLLVEPDGRTAFLIAPGANQTLAAGRLEAALRPLLPHLDGLLLNFEAPEAALLRAVTLAEQHNLPVFVDAGPFRPYSPRLWQHAAVLTPNEAETTALVGHPVDEDEAALAAARTLLAQGPQAVVIKRGARGALWATPTAWGREPAFPITAVDTAGAGDAFSAGLVLALLQGQPLPQAVRFANACGAIAAGRFGTMPAMPRAEEVAALLAGPPG